MLKYIPTIIQFFALSVPIFLYVRIERKYKAAKKKRDKAIEARTKAHKEIMKSINAQKN
jgi:large-conductance mechanosensitive channel